MAAVVGTVVLGVTHLMTCGESSPDERAEAMIRSLREEQGFKTEGGCGEPLVFGSLIALARIFRCLECGRWMHQRCLEAHFTESGHDGAAHPEVKRLRELLKPFAHHARPGDSTLDESERSVRVTVGQLTRAWFALPEQDRA
jgi:hypothetical protein